MPDTRPKAMVQHPGTQPRRMRIVIVGADGFIGRAIWRRLAEAGHEVVPAIRRVRRGGVTGQGPQPIFCDLAHDSAGIWKRRLQGVDAVVNAVGLFQQTRHRRFAQLHHTGPAALFDGARAAGVAKVVQISALGADDGAASAYHLSKRAADQHLRGFDPDAGDPAWVILRPSIVVGRGGATTTLLARLGRLPLRFTAGTEGWPVQPIHIDDLANLAAVLLVDPRARREVVDAVGPEAMPFHRLIDLAGRWSGGGRHLSVPLGPRWWSLAAAIGDHIPGQPFDRAALSMLRRGNTDGTGDVERWLGRRPVTVDTALAFRPATAVERAGFAALSWRWALVLALAAFWIATAAISLWVYPRADSLALLDRVGLTGWWATAALYAASAWDMLLGAGLLVRRRRRLAAWLQVATMLVFTAIIAAALPEFLAHPFGPVTKNLPILAATLMLIALEE